MFKHCYKIHFRNSENSRFHNFKKETKMKALNKKNLKKINSLLNAIQINRSIADRDYLDSTAYDKSKKSKEALKKYYFGKWMLANKELLQIQLFNEFGICISNAENDAKREDDFIADEQECYLEYDAINSQLKGEK